MTESNMSQNIDQAAKTVTPFGYTKTVWFQILFWHSLLCIWLDIWNDLTLWKEIIN